MPPGLFSLSRDEQGRLRPQRQVVHIENRTGCHGGSYWALTLECGHFKCVSSARPKDGVRAMFRRIRFAPAYTRCYTCTVDTPVGAVASSCL
jgi:hypothetical protein